MICKCFLQLLLASAVTAVMFKTILQDVIVRDPSSSSTMTSICLCKAVCFVELYCTAVSYVRATSLCSMTFAAPQFVNMSVESDVVTFFKIKLNAVVFVTMARTANGSLGIQTTMCADEGGFLLLIKTVKDHQEARIKVEGNGVLITGERFAFVSANGSMEENTLFWPDGSEVSEEKFGVFRTRAAGGNSSVFGHSGYFYFAKQQSQTEYPVLCFRYLPAV